MGKRIAQLAPLALAPLALAACALGGAWHALARRGDDSNVAPTPQSAAGRAPLEQEELVAPPVASDSRGAQAERERVEPAARPEPHAAPEPAGDVVWVDGRVLLPPGTPADERVAVVASGKRLADGSRHSAWIGADGSFRVAFADEPGDAWLALEARYAYLAEPVQVADDAAPRPGSWTLAPELGGRIAGRLVPPAGARGSRADVAGEEVRLTGPPPRVGDDALWRSVRPPRLGDELDFAFDALPAGEPYQLAFDAGCYPPLELGGLVVEPGRTSAIELRPALGARVEGRVVDAAAPRRRV